MSRVAWHARGVGSENGDSGRNESPPLWDGGRLAPGRAAPGPLPLGDAVGATQLPTRRRTTARERPARAGAIAPRRGLAQEAALGVDDLARDPAGLVRAQPRH